MSAMSDDDHDVVYSKSKKPRHLEYVKEHGDGNLSRELGPALESCIFNEEAIEVQTLGQ